MEHVSTVHKSRIQGATILDSGSNLSASYFSAKQIRNTEGNFKPNIKPIGLYIKERKAQISRAVRNKRNYVFARSNPALLNADIERGDKNAETIPSVKGKFSGSGSFALFEFGMKYELAKRLNDVEQIGGNY